MALLGGGLPVHSIVLALLLAGCARAPAVTPAAPPASPPTAPPETVYLVVEASDSPDTKRTVLLGAEGRPLATVDGMLVGTGDGGEIFELVRTASEAAAPSCRVMFGDGPADPGEWKTVSWVFRGLSSGREFEVVSPAHDENATNLDQSASIEGVYGPNVFVRESLYAYSCGAHGYIDVSARLVDLATASTLRAADAVPLVDEALRREAAARLAASVGAIENERIDPAALEATALVPSFVEGKLVLELQLTTESCYACSDGRWSSYTRSTLGPIALPEPLRVLPELPAPLRAYVREHPSVLGVSWTTRADAAALGLCSAASLGTHRARLGGGTTSVSGPSYESAQ